MGPTATSANSRAPRRSRASSPRDPRAISWPSLPTASAASHVRAAVRQRPKTMPARLAFTCGDPAGIGPEIIAAWLAANPAEAPGVAVIGPVRWLDSLPATVLRVPVGLEEFAATPGQPDGDGALVAWAAM